MDHVQDENSVFLHRLSKLVDIPTFVKEASVGEDVKELPAKVFGDSLTRTFPLHTPADTWLSREYFDKFASQDMSEYNRTRIGKRIAEAVSFWDIPPATMSKEASTIPKPSGFRISYSLQGKEHTSAHVTTEEELFKVAEDLHENYTRYPWEMRKGVAQQVLQAAPVLRATFTAPMQSMLEKTSAYALGQLKAATEAIQRREHALVNKQPHLLPALKEAREACQKEAQEGMLGPDMLDKVAGMLVCVDRLAGLHSLGRVEDALFCTTVSDVDMFKQAAYILPSGQTVLKEDLQKFASRRFMSEAFGIQDITRDNALEKVATLSPKLSSVLYDFLQERQVPA